MLHMTRGASGHAIFLNGIPSSGKSSAAAQIEARTSTFRVFTGDDVIKRFSPQQAIQNWRGIFAMTLDEVEELMKSCNLVIDGAWSEGQVIDAQERFSAGLFVVLRIDEVERRRREGIRRDRQVRHWDPAWMDMPGPDTIYDLAIDARTKAPSDCADLILAEAIMRWQGLTL